MSECSCTNGNHVLGELKYSHQSPVVCKGPVTDADDGFRQFQFAREVTIIEYSVFNRDKILRQNKLPFEETIAKSSTADRNNSIMKF